MEKRDAPKTTFTKSPLRKSRQNRPGIGVEPPHLAAAAAGVVGEDNLSRLRERGLTTKRSLALREFALGIEAIESEPVDPRL